MPKEQLTVRPYQEGDIPYMVTKCEEIVPTLPHYANMKVSKPRLDYLLRQNLNPQSGWAAWVLVDSKNEIHGIGCGYCVPAIISTDLVANDVLLYIKPEWRSLKHADLLVGTYVKWAKTKGAKLIKAAETAGFVKTDEEQAVYERFLSRYGFKRAGSIYHLVN